MITTRRVICTAFLPLLLSAFLVWSGETEARRIAVVDVGEGEVSESFIDLLEMRLLQQRDKLVLLERGEVDQLLGEQHLGLLANGYVDALGSGICGDRLWMHKGTSKLLILHKGKDLDAAQTIENDLLAGNPAEWFIESPYGLLAIGHNRIGLITAEKSN